MSGTRLELHVPDFAPVHAFYGALGFVVEREIKGVGAEPYLVVRRGAATL